MKHFNLDLLSILLIFVSIIPNQALAEFKFEKVEKKTISRWTLQEWLEQKNRNRLMDQWLMMNTPSPYEFSIQLTNLNFTTSEITNDLASAPSANHTANFVDFIAYASFVGLEYQYHILDQTNSKDKNILFHIRLLGSADQSSHFTISLGQRQKEFSTIGTPQRSQYLTQADLTFYFNHHFGFKVLARDYLAIKSDPTWGDLKGQQQEAHLFIDFNALRVFGGIYLETETQVLKGDKKIQSYSGSVAGLRLYF